MEINFNMVTIINKSPHKCNCMIFLSTIIIILIYYFNDYYFLYIYIYIFNIFFTRFIFFTMNTLLLITGIKIKNN